MTGEFLPNLDGYRHLELENCTSTNSTCFEYALEGELSGLWVTAKTQSGGKGSRGRGWVSKEGNLYASLLLRDPCAKEQMAELTFVAAVAAHDALSEICGEAHSVQLKWPNDVMLNGKKCGGILLESRFVKSEMIVVIGIGINCQHFPDETLHPATSLASEHVDVDTGLVFDKLAKAMARNIILWDKGAGFQAIRETWLNNAFGIKEQITVRIPGQSSLTGTFTSIDKSGYMLLLLKDGTTRRVSTADIFLL